MKMDLRGHILEHSCNVCTSSVPCVLYFGAFCCVVGVVMGLKGMGIW